MARNRPVLDQIQARVRYRLAELRLWGGSNVPDHAER